MKKTLFAVLLSFLLVLGAGNAFAFGNNYGGDGGDANNTSTNTNVNTNAALNTNTNVNGNLNKNDIDVFVGNGFGNFSPSAISGSKATAIAPTFNTNKQMQGQMQGQGQFMINHIEAPDMEPVGEGLSDIGKGIAVGGIAQGLGDAVNGIAQGAGTAYAGHVNAEAQKYAADVEAETALAINVNTNNTNQAMAADANETATEIAEINAEAAKEAAHRSREFAPAGQLVTGGGADYRGPWEDKGPTVMDLPTILGFQNVWTYKDVKGAQSGVFEDVRVRFRSTAGKYKGKTTPELAYTMERKAPAGTKLLGFMYAYATGDEADTVHVLQKATKAACEEGAIVAVVVGHGYTSVTDTWGWGFGISGVWSGMSENGRTGATGHSGTGWNKAKSGPEFKPYVQLALFGVK